MLTTRNKPWFVHIPEMPSAKNYGQENRREKKRKNKNRNIE